MNDDVPGCDLSSEPYEDAIEFVKFQARIILNATNRKIIIPSREEMIGLYALERDDQLPPRKLQS